MPTLDDATIERIADRVHLFFNMNWERFESGDSDLFKQQLRDAIREATANPARCVICGGSGYVPPSDIFLLPCTCSSAIPEYGTEAWRARVIRSEKHKRLRREFETLASEADD